MTPRDVLAKIRHAVVSILNGPRALAVKEAALGLARYAAISHIDKVSLNPKKIKSNSIHRNPVACVSVACASSSSPSLASILLLAFGIVASLLKIERTACHISLRRACSPIVIVVFVARCCHRACRCLLLSRL
ncbi:hypothetical protein ACSQ67_001168 [Phaseolus vulgaris]